MSRRSQYENLLDFSSCDENVDSEMDIPSDFHNSELMSSEFFDSVLSMEQPDFVSSFDTEILGTIEDDLCLSNASSSHADEVLSTNSFSSDGDKWTPNSNLNEVNLQEVDDDLFSSLLTSQYTGMECIETPKQKAAKPPVQNKLGQSAKKVILTKPYASNLKKNNFKNKPQLLRVQSGNGRSLLLPFNIANVKSIKILNSAGLQTQNLKLNPSTSVPMQQQTHSVSSVSSTDTLEDEDNDVSSEEVQYPALNLTAEEKRLLAKDGVQLPTHYPLTKNEERELKRIRRKIRNKISAQDSRKRKKEYVDGLEERVKRGSEENKFLLKRVKQLQQQNSRLMSQMSKLQALLLNSSASKAAPTTCLMIVLFSALLVSLPNLGLNSNKEVSDQQQVAARRALLFSQQATNEDDALNMDEFLMFNKEGEEFEGVVEAEDETVNKTEKAALVKLLNEISQKYNIPADKINCSEKLGGIDKLGEYCSKYEKEIKMLMENMKEFFGGDAGNSKIDYGLVDENGFIEPDIDDYVGVRKRVFVGEDEFEVKKIKLEEATVVGKGGSIKKE